MFDLDHFSPEFSTNEVEEVIPFNKLVMVNGFIVPIENLPDDMQILAREARAEGRDISFHSR